MMARQIDTPTKRYPLRVVLSVTTGRLLTVRLSPTDNGIGALYSILGWMTNDAPYTHQLGRFACECSPWLLRWFPELSSAKVDALKELMKLHGREMGVDAWLAALAVCTDCRAEYAVPRIPVDDHTETDAYDELVVNLGSDDKIVLLGDDT